LVAGDVVSFVPIAWAAAPLEAATVLPNGAEAFLGECLAATALWGGFPKPVYARAWPIPYDTRALLPS
jgi:hypothetical protein